MRRADLGPSALAWVPLRDYEMKSWHAGILALRSHYCKGEADLTVNETSPKWPGRNPQVQGFPNAVRGMALNRKSSSCRMPS